MSRLNSSRHAVSKLLAVFALVVPAAVPHPAWAWGNEGHRVTGLVADGLLTPKARIRLNHLVPNYNLGDFANQMDVFRTALTIEIPGSDKWHYDNQPICGVKTYDAYCPNGDCASSKIPVYFRILADTKAGDEARAQAAMFLVHMVGDIHQPLHAADDADRGGNDKNVMYPGVEMPRNLHRVWDSELPKTLLRGANEADFARQLITRYKDKEVAQWQQGEVRDWMNESHALSQKVVYGKLPEFTCGVQWPMEKVVSLPQSYVDAATEILPVQLAKAGARIAWLLNRALDPAPDAKPAADTKPAVPAPAAETKPVPVKPVYY